MVSNHNERPKRYILKTVQIETLRLAVTESDLNVLAVRFLPPHAKVRRLRIGIVPQGVRVTGVYQSAIAITFETVWELLVCEGKLGARLVTLKTGFWSLSLAKGYVLAAIAAAAKILELRGDMLLVDVDALCRDRGLCLSTNLSSVRCHQGTLEIVSNQSS